ncbi:hypothetical protein PPL_03576 [Heterostelium album PN500]|uniref:B box-type domain-containing protein n=1 Tax=Heterostelium pallidum (strain ATCC 26659 / Pp 5 / PN500) TaxID=670386 RepID=D3B564_HETP5|nr:hypothetical protein PPL_03576 [Heterostelium album PN500]EFA83429.1 hypothetical protein PPL_03576 [Heterostelium album PN500]|eukprot:XP_020435546.1 hypothetical protein PPL_03576 [Heterostelium album PN500]
MNLCSVHFKEIIFLCSTCSKLVCKQCCVSDHSKHQFDDFDSIKDEELKTNGYQDKISNLFDRLKTIKSTIDSLESTLSEIIKFYEEMHNFLIVEEHKNKKPVEEQLELAKSLIPLVIEEINSLKVITNTIHHNESSSGTHVIQSPGDSENEHQKYDINSKEVGDLLQVVEQSVDHNQVFQEFPNFFPITIPVDTMTFLSLVSRQGGMEKNNLLITPAKYLAIIDHNQTINIKSKINNMCQVEKFQDNRTIVYHNSYYVKFLDLQTHKTFTLKDVEPSQMVQKTITNFKKGVQQINIQSVCYNNIIKRIYVLHKSSNNNSQIESIDPINLNHQVNPIIPNLSNPTLLVINGLVYIVDTSCIYTMSDTFQCTPIYNLQQFNMRLCTGGDNCIIICTNTNTWETFDLQSKTFSVVSGLIKKPTNSLSYSKIVYVPSSGTNPKILTLSK